MRNQIAAAQGWRCLDCGELLPARFDIDHQIPLWQGGSNDLNNLAALDPGCHAKRTALQMQLYWDHQTELRTGRSKYFDPFSAYYNVQ